MADTIHSERAKRFLSDMAVAVERLKEGESITVTVLRKCVCEYYRPACACSGYGQEAYMLQFHGKRASMP